MGIPSQTRTPTLDALAANGTTLTDFHADHICCPSRAALMTGRFAGDVSFNGNIDVSKDGAVKNPSHGFAYQLPTPAGDGASPWAGGLLNLGSLMQSHGYKTAHIGKWVSAVINHLLCSYLGGILVPSGLPG